MDKLSGVPTVAQVLQASIDPVDFAVRRCDRCTCRVRRLRAGRLLGHLFPARGLRLPLDVLRGDPAWLGDSASSQRLVQLALHLHLPRHPAGPRGREGAAVAAHLAPVRPLPPSRLQRRGRAPLPAPRRPLRPRPPRHGHLLLRLALVQLHTRPLCGHWAVCILAPARLESPSPPPTRPPPLSPRPAPLSGALEGTTPPSLPPSTPPLSFSGCCCGFARRPAG